MTYADYLKFNIQWSEWISEAGLGTNQLLPATDAADWHLGVYDKTKGVWLNPQEGSSLTGWDSEKLVLAFNEYDPKTKPGGSIGDVIYFSSTKGLFEKTETITVDSTVIMRQVDAKKRDFTDYENTKKSYDKDLEKYDDDITTEEERKKDFFKSTFDPPVKIPQRPTIPS